jgi:uracil-DNA glycosylase
LIDTSKHFVLESAHPSPLSAASFFGCKHFSETNKILKRQGVAEIDWKIKD